jgi:hypothetical protein
LPEKGWRILNGKAITFFAESHDFVHCTPNCQRIEVPKGDDKTLEFNNLPANQAEFSAWHSSGILTQS